jgi:hypothetical protein
MRSPALRGGFSRLAGDSLGAREQAGRGGGTQGKWTSTGTTTTTTTAAAASVATGVWLVALGRGGSWWSGRPGGEERRLRLSGIDGFWDAAFSTTMKRGPSFTD